MNTGTSGSVSGISSADSRSIVATQPTTASGIDAGEDELRQVAREVALERLDAVDRRGRDLAGLRAVDRDRLGGQPPGDEIQPQLGQHVAPPARRPATSIPQPSTPRAANASGEQHEVGAQAGERGAVGRAGHDPPEQHGCAMTGTTVATPSAVSSASSGRTDRVRRTSRRSSAGMASARRRRPAPPSRTRNTW